MILKRNRMRVKKPKLRSYWCVCDRDLVGMGRKCAVCGRRNLTGKKKFKKDVDIDQEDVL